MREHHSTPGTSGLAARGTVSGTITLAQERRFQLVDGLGVAHLFVLDRSAPVDPRKLTELAACAARVEVYFRDNESDLIARVATDIDLAPVATRITV